MTRTVTGPAFDVEAVRRDFPILNKPLPSGVPLVYLDSGASAQKPRQVLDKLMECYENYYANAHRGVYYFGVRVDEELEASREKIQRFIGARQPEEIVFTAGTTMSINLVAYGWGRKFLKPGDEIVLNEMEHHANLVPWQQLARDKQAKLRYLPLTPDGRLDMSQLDEILNERTRLVAVSGMSNVLGTINPIEEIAAQAHRYGALVVVDAAQTAPHMPIDVRSSQIDFLTFSGHKLFGPTGVGVLYGRRELLEATEPFLTGGGMIDEVYPMYSTWGELPAKFEAGTLPIAQAIALGAAVDYVKNIGFEAIHAHEQRLLEKAHDVLQQIPGLVIHGPAPEYKGAIVSFSVEGLHPHDLAQLLDQKGVACRASHHCTMLLHEWLKVPATTRASFALYNTEAEVDALADAIQFARKKFRLA